MPCTLPKEKEVSKSQLETIKESANRLLDRGKPLSERVKNLFKEQGITIASVLTAVGMVLGFLIKSLVSGGTKVIKVPTGGEGGGSKVPVKEW